MNQSFSLPTLQPPSAVSFLVSTPERNISTTTLVPSSTTAFSPSPKSAALTERFLQDLARPQDRPTTGPADGTKTPSKLTARLKSYFSSTESIKRLRPVRSFSKLKFKARGTTSKTPTGSTALSSHLDRSLEGRPTEEKTPHLWSLSTGSRPSFKRPGLTFCIRPGSSLNSPPGLNLQETFAAAEGDCEPVVEFENSQLLGKLSFEQQSIDSRAEQTQAEKERVAWKKRESKTGVTWEERMEVLDVCRGEISFESRARGATRAAIEPLTITQPLKASVPIGRNDVSSFQNLPEIVRSNRMMNRRLSRHGLRPSQSFDLDSRLTTIESSPRTSPTSSFNKPDRNSNSYTTKLDGQSPTTHSNPSLSTTRWRYGRQMRVPKRMSSTISLPPLVPIPPLDPTPPNFPLDESYGRIEHPTSSPVSALSYPVLSKPTDPAACASVSALPQTTSSAVANPQTTTISSTTFTPNNTFTDRPGSIWRTQIIGRYYDISGFLEGSETEIDPSPLKCMDIGSTKLDSSVEQQDRGREKKERKGDSPPRLEAYEILSPILFSLDFSMTSENAEMSCSSDVGVGSKTKVDQTSTVQGLFANFDGAHSLFHNSSSDSSSVNPQLSPSAVNPFRIPDPNNVDETTPELFDRSESSSCILPYIAMPSPSSSSPIRAVSSVALREIPSTQPVRISSSPAQQQPIINPIDVPLPPSPSDDISGFSFSAYATLWTPPRQTQSQSHHTVEPSERHVSPRSADNQTGNVISPSPSTLSPTSSVVDQSGDLSISSNLEVEVKFGTASRLISSVPRVVYRSPCYIDMQPLLGHRLYSNSDSTDRGIKEEERGEDSDGGSDYIENEGLSDQDLSPCVARSVFLSSRIPKSQPWESSTPSKLGGRASKPRPAASSPSAGMSYTPSLAPRERSRSSFRLNSSLIAEFGQGALSTSTPTASEVSLQMFRRKIKDVLEAGMGDTFSCSSIDTSQAENEPGQIDQFISELIVEERMTEEHGQMHGDQRETDEEGQGDEQDDSFAYALEHPEEAVELQYNLEVQTNHLVSSTSAESSTRNRSSTRILANEHPSPVTPHIQRQRRRQFGVELEDDHGNSSDLGSFGKEIMRLAREKGQSKLLKRATGRSIRNELESNRRKGKETIRI